MKTTESFNNTRTIPRPFSWLATVTILVAFVSCQSAHNASATIYTVSIPGAAPWTDTGINIPTGSLVGINASGIVTYGFSPGQSSGPNGGDMGTQFESGTVLANTVVVSLIGKIGGTTAVGSGTPVPGGTPGDGPGFVGTSYNQTISTGGELFLGFNDQVGGFGDNSGAFSVTVTVVPEPSITAFAGLGGFALLAGRMRRSTRTHIKIGNGRVA